MTGFGDRELLPARLVFTGIVHWTHPDGPAHCLGRLFTGSAGWVAIVSKVRTCQSNRGPGGQMPAVGTAFVRAVPDQLDLMPAQVTWLAHYGEFSGWSLGGAPEGFLEVPLDWEDDHYRPHSDMRTAVAGMRRPEPAEVTELLLGGLRLEDPLTVLERLGKPCR